jgi:pimeloyl-ACP methyl ester carboxylesterase
MPETTAEVEGSTFGRLTLAYELIGDGSGQPWVLTPGGRFPKETPGLRELAVELATAGNQVLIWDRPNTGSSDVCFTGASESAMQADALAALLRHLELGPTVVAGGSGGSRVSLLTAARHRDLAAGLALWWISGGVLGLMSLGHHYCYGSLHAAWQHDMAAVADLDEWQEVIERNPGNRQRILDQDRVQFVATFEDWMLAYCPCGDELVPGLADDDARALDLPALVFRSGESDAHHTRETSERVAELLPNSRLVEPPWGDREWMERQVEHDRGLFVRWPLLAPQLLEWAGEVL